MAQALKNIKCSKCGRKSHEFNEECPAKGKQCNECGKTNHFSNVCRNSTNKSFQNQSHSSTKQASCSNCGRKRHEADETCPAKGKHCKRCNKPNHFANVCRSNSNIQIRDINNVTNSTHKHITQIQTIHQNGPQINFNNVQVRPNESKKSKEDENLMIGTAIGALGNLK